MTYRIPARLTTHPIRIRSLRVAGLLVVIVAIAAVLGYRSLAASFSTAASPIDVLRSEFRGVLGEALPSTVWPAFGQAAVQIGQSQIQAAPNQHVAAIASAAKVMTAYLVLRDHPLQHGQDGRTITFTDADVAGTVHNTDRLLGHNGYVGVKTGSDELTGGCFAVRAVRRIDGKQRTITGVVLVQPGHNQVEAGLASAAAMVDRIARERATPDLGQPALLPLTAPGSYRSRLRVHVRRP